MWIPVSVARLHNQDKKSLSQNWVWQQLHKKSTWRQMPSTGDVRILKQTEVRNFNQGMVCKYFANFTLVLMALDIRFLNEALYFSDVSKQTSCFGVQQWLPLKWSLDKTNQNKWSLLGSLTSIDPSPYLHQPALGEEVLPKCEGWATNTRCNCLKIWSRSSTTRIYKKNRWQVLVIEDFRTHRSQKIINRWDQYLKNVKTLKTLEKLKLQDFKLY